MLGFIGFQVGIGYSGEEINLGIFVNWICKHIVFLSIFLTACAVGKQIDYKKEHQDFMRQADRARSEMDRKVYKSWLNRKLQEKQSHLKALSSWEKREEKIYGQHEMLESSTSATGAGPDVHEFKARNSAQQMHHYAEQRKIIEREIFYINSQLSALENSKEKTSN